MFNEEDLLEMLNRLETTMIPIAFHDRTPDDEDEITFSLGLLRAVKEYGTNQFDVNLIDRVDLVISALVSTGLWTDVFFRKTNSPAYEQVITPKDIKDGRLVKLFNDCFSLFNTPNVQNPGYLNIVNAEDNLEFIPCENLQAAFYLNERYYTPPPLLLKQHNLREKEIDYPEFLENATKKVLFGQINNISIINGEIGTGKTSLVIKLMYDKMKLGADRDFIFRFDIELHYRNDNGANPKPIDNDFYVTLATSFCASLHEYSVSSKIIKDAIDIDEFHLEVFSPQNGNPVVYINNSVRQLNDIDIKTTIIIDNLDRYSFHTDRYTFFREGQEHHEKNIGQIGTMHTDFLVGDFKSMQGSVIFVVRDYVLARLMINQNAQGLTGHQMSSIYTIKPINPNEAIQKRLKLYFRVFRNLPKNLRDKFKIGPDEILRIFKFGLGKGDTANTYHSQQFIYQLCHQKLRSIVDFTSKLAIDVSNQDAVKRFLNGHSMPLIFLYMLNSKHRYTQNDKHFPNLFLVDCLAYKDHPEAEGYQMAHQSHRHTYWVKIFIMIYIQKKSISRPNRAVTGDEIHRIFTEKGNYESHMIKLCLGSLSSFNEMACIEIKYAVHGNVGNCPLSLTTRGETLLSIQSNQVPFYLSFPYLQVIIDDYLLWFPKLDCTSFEHEQDYSYLHETSQDYFLQGSNLIEERAESLLYFIPIIEEFMKIEIDNNPDLFCEEHFKESWLPNLVSVKKSLTRFFRGEITEHMLVQEFSESRLLQITNEVTESEELKEFFEKIKINPRLLQVEY